MAMMALAIGVNASAFAHGGEKHRDERAVQSEAVEPASEISTVAVPPASVAESEEHDRNSGRMLANLHPATVHFPIAMLLFASLAEFLSLRRWQTRLRPAASVMAAIGGIGASVAAIFGWIHTGLWLGGDGAMLWHRWLGTALGLAGPIIAWLALRPSQTRTALRVLLALASIAVVAQGWLGGELAHGAGHLFG